MLTQKGWRDLDELLTQAGPELKVLIPGEEIEDYCHRCAAINSTMYFVGMGRAKSDPSFTWYDPPEGYALKGPLGNGGYGWEHAESGRSASQSDWTPTDALRDAERDAAKKASAKTEP